MPEGNSQIKVTGILVVLLRGVNCRFWSHLGCLNGNSLYLPIQVSLRKCTKTKRMVSLGISLSLNHTHIGLPWGLNFNFLTSVP